MVTTAAFANNYGVILIKERPRGLGRTRRTGGEANVFAHGDVRINVTLAATPFRPVSASVFSPPFSLFFSLFLFATVASYVGAAEEQSVPFISALSASSFAFCRLLCFLPLPGIKLRGSGCLYSRGFSNYMFNLFSRPRRFAPGILQRGWGEARGSRVVGEWIPP